MPAEGSVLSWPAKREAASDGAVAGVASEPRGTTMHDRFEVSVSFDERRGYGAGGGAGTLVTDPPVSSSDPNQLALANIH
jgi:hypothetical protein